MSFFSLDPSTLSDEDLAAAGTTLGTKWAADIRVVEVLA